MWICEKCSAINNDDELAMCPNCGEFNIQKTVESEKERLEHLAEEKQLERSKTLKQESSTERPVHKKVLDQIKTNMNGKTYKIQEVGKQFSAAGIKALENQFNTNSKNGWNFHSVIEIQKQTPAGCLSTQTITTTTYLAVYTK